MSNSFDIFKKQYRRLAVKLNRTDNTTLSQWGACTIANDKHKDWPISHNGHNLNPVIELNLSDLPMRIERFKDIELLQIFMDPVVSATPSKTPQKCDGRYIHVRTFTASDLLTKRPLFVPPTVQHFVPHSYIAGEFIDDFPMDDVLYTADFFEEAYEREMTLDEEDTLHLNFFSKIGGWPHFITGGIRESSVEYGDFVFQLDTDCGYEWGRSGTCFFFYKEITDEWFYYWESFPI